MDQQLPHVVVVGGGITGLAAAWYLMQGPHGPRATVTVLEAGERFGGKVALHDFAGVELDCGAEALLATRPEAVNLCKDLGLVPVPAVTTQAAIYSRGRMRPVPKGLLTGVPTDLRSLAASGVVSLPGLLRIPLDHLLPRTVMHGDVSVGDYVATRLGRELTDRLVEPMLGGVYAGRAEDLSLQMTVPSLYRAATTRRSAIASASSVLSDGLKTTGPRRGPVFVGLEGGVGRLPQALVTALRAHGVKLHTSAVVQQVRSRAARWDVVTGDGRGRYVTHTADAVMFATPAPVTGRLLQEVNSAAAQELAEVEYADVAIVTLGYPTAAARHLRGSGFLVPPVEGYAVKGVTYSSAKWDWVARQARSSDEDGLFIVRASLGRAGDPVVAESSDDELIRLAADDLAALTGLPRRPLVEAVTRWQPGLPQYAVGHRARVADIREELSTTPGLTVCGAAYEGVGIAACIGSAQAAVSTVLQELAERMEWDHG
ncbi:MAG TPA: protoporphyrinogen oxidase [Actinomycetota bacterium]|nr:protoporphyrinogen oxidase [Actinomycetota bacterium]